MTTNIEKPQEKIEFYCREPGTWADSAVRAGARSGVRGGVIFIFIFIIFNYISLGMAVAVAVVVAVVAAAIASIFPVFGTVAVAVAVAFVVVAIGGLDSSLFLSIFLMGLLGGVLGGLLSYAIVRFCYAVVVDPDRVSSKFIVYTDAKGEHFFIDAMSAHNIIVAMQAAPDLKIIETGGVRGLNIISGKLGDFLSNQKIIDSEAIAKGDNLAVQWQAIQEVMAKLVKEGGGASRGRNANVFIAEALEIAGFAENNIEKIGTT